MRASLLVAMAVLSGGASSETKNTRPTMEIGGIALRLGMPQDRLIAQLADQFNLQKLSETGPNTGWMVTAKGPGGGAVANVIFTAGRLASIRRYWSPEDQTQGVPLAKAVHAVLEGFAREGRRQCSLLTGTNRQPGAEVRTAVLDCSGRRLEITVVATSTTDEVATVDEILEAR